MQSAILDINLLGMSYYLPASSRLINILVYIQHPPIPSHTADSLLQSTRVKIPLTGIRPAEQILSFPGPIANTCTDALQYTNYSK